MTLGTVKDRLKSRPNIAILRRRKADYGQPLASVESSPSVCKEVFCICNNRSNEKENKAAGHSDQILRPF